MRRDDDYPDELWVVLLAWILLALTFAGPAWRTLHPERPVEHPTSQEGER